MVRIIIQDDLIVSMESMNHLESLDGIDGIFIEDSILDGIRLPAKVVYADGKIAGYENLPEPEPTPSEPTPDEQRDALLLDIDYRLTLIENGGTI